ncbi:hypothetical protein QAD02_016446 [Eretmocerus hayati]|uniref:Uncharacterized protein n=1 Tax=Eretmocerus hayati TaxID=131215 RepID=A0ACC2PDK1_9HYME|nr:hypothetical protein QAD02_016446 [Eretmocerus hayati]
MNGLRRPNQQSEESRRLIQETEEVGPTASRRAFPTGSPPSSNTPVVSSQDDRAILERRRVQLVREFIERNGNSNVWRYFSPEHMDNLAGPCNGARDGPGLSLRLAWASVEANYQNECNRMQEMLIEVDEIVEELNRRDSISPRQRCRYPDSPEFSE